jgi:putative ABC transport system permease protein
VSGWADLGYAWRSLRHTPRFTATVVATLALGLGANVAIFSVVKGAILDPWPYTAADRIVVVRANFPRLGLIDAPTFSAPEVADLEAQTSVFERTLVGVARNLNLTAPGRVDRIHGVAISASAFSMLGVDPLLGRVFTSAEDVPHGPRLVVLAYSMWQGHFAGDPAIVGRTIDVEGDDYTVIGVMPHQFVFWDAQLYFPLELDRQGVDRSNRPFILQGRLQPGVTPQSAIVALNTLARRLERDHRGSTPEYEGFRFTIRPLRDEVLRDVRQALLTLSLSVGLVLLIVMVNLANLCIARAVTREQELALRIALGASRLHLLRQCLAEGALLGVLSGGVAIVLASASVRAVLSLIPYGYIPAEAIVRLDGTTVALAFALSLVLGAVLGVVPLFGWSHRATAGVIAGGARTIGGRRRGVRQVLVVSQVAVALVVISAALFLTLGVRRLMALPMGFEADGVHTMRVAFAQQVSANDMVARALIRDTVQHIAALPGVTAAAAVTALPLSGAPAASVVLEGVSGPSAGTMYGADDIAVSPGYFATLAIRAVAGRDFADRDDAAAPLVAIVNQTMAERFWPERDPIGKRIRLAEGGDPRWMTVVGVAADVRQEDVDRAPRPAMFRPIAQIAPVPRALSIVLRGNGNAETLINEVRAAVGRVAPDVPLYAVAPMSQVVAESLGGRRLAAWLLAVFGVTALALASLGTAALAAQTVSARRREIAVRLALGALPSEVMTHFLRDISKLVGVGVGVGMVLSAIVTRSLTALLVGMTPQGLTTPAIAAASLLIATLVACVLPIRSAASIDPARALRSD